MVRHLQAAALALAALPLSVAAATTFEQIWGADGSNWGLVAFAGIVLATFFSALAYMFSRAFRQRHLEAWAKSEIYQALGNILLLGFLFGFLFFFTDPSTGLIGQLAKGNTVCAATTGDYPHIDCVRTMLNNTRAALEDQAGSLLAVNMRVQMYATMGRFWDFSMNWPPYTSDPLSLAVALQFAKGFRVSPFAGVGLIGDSLGLLFQALFMWIASMIAQEFFLQLVRDALFPITLALGLIMRTFFFTRKLGGLLIAIAVGLYAVYPLLYILLAPQFIAAQDPAARWTDMYDQNSGTCSSANVAFNCPVRFNWLEYPVLFLFIYSPEVNSILPQNNILDPNGISFDWLAYASNFVGTLSVHAVFIPAIIVYITIAFIKGLSAFLGGDMEIAGLTHLI